MAQYPQRRKRTGGTPAPGPNTRAKKPGGTPGDRPNTRPKNSPGGVPEQGPSAEEIRDDPKALKNWLDRHQQKALAGGLLSGPLAEDGTGSAVLIDLLRSNPELAARVREFTKTQAALFRETPGIERTGGRKDLLFQQFPELYQQYIAATGQDIIYDAEGNPVRVVDPNGVFGMREGDELVSPTLYGADGTEQERPVFGDEGGVVGSEAANQFLAARAARQAAQSGGYFSLDELQGGES